MVLLNLRSPQCQMEYGAHCTLHMSLLAAEITAVTHKAALQKPPISISEVLSL